MALEGKRIVVLGGTSGIGFATAKGAAKEGALVVVASSNQTKVDTALSQLPASAEGKTIDLKSEDSIREFFAAIGPFDHLVYTAGDSLKMDEIKNTSFADAQAFLQTRFWGAYLSVKYAADQIRQGGSIVLSSGMAGRRPRKAWTLVASICGAMESFTRALAVELAPLRVNIVCPGQVKTELWNALPEEAREAMWRRAEQLFPVGRAGEPEEAAEAYLYLMRAGFTTGSVVIADGGASLV